MPHWREALYNFIEREAKPVEKFGHQPRLYVLTKQIGRGLEYDDDVVYAAVWLHDLGVFYGHRPEDPAELSRWNNTAYAMDRAPDILTGFGFPAEKIAAVVDAIANHQASASPAAMEAVIIRDADILEQLGSIGVLRTVCKVGRDTRFTTFTHARDSLERALETLPAQLRLDASREMAKARVGLLREFLVGVERESFGALF